jgi:hypothetical protein
LKNLVKIWGQESGVSADASSLVWFPLSPITYAALLIRQSVVGLKLYSGATVELQVAGFENDTRNWKQTTQFKPSVRFQKAVTQSVE